MLAGSTSGTNRIDEARAEYEAMVKRDPSALHARTMIGMLLNNRERPPMPKRPYEVGGELNDNAPIAANNLRSSMPSRARTSMSRSNSPPRRNTTADDASVDDTIGCDYYKKTCVHAVRSLEESLKSVRAPPTCSFT